MPAAGAEAASVPFTSPAAAARRRPRARACARGAQSGSRAWILARHTHARIQARTHAHTHAHTHTRTKWTTRRESEGRVVLPAAAAGWTGCASLAAAGASPAAPCRVHTGPKHASEREPDPTHQRPLAPPADPEAPAACRACALARVRARRERGREQPAHLAGSSRLELGDFILKQRKLRVDIPHAAPRAPPPALLVVPLPPSTPHSTAAAQVPRTRPRVRACQSCPSKFETSCCRPGARTADRGGGTQTSWGGPDSSGSRPRLRRSATRRCSRRLAVTPDFLLICGCRAPRGPVSPCVQRARTAARRVADGVDAACRLARGGQNKAARGHRGHGTRHQQAVSPQAPASPARPRAPRSLHPRAGRDRARVCAADARARARECGDKRERTLPRGMRKKRVTVRSD